MTNSRSFVRRAAAPVLVGTAVFAFVLAGILAFWAPTHVVKTPLDADSVSGDHVLTMVFQGTGSKFDINTGKALDHKFKVTRNTRIDTAASNDDVAVLVATQCVVTNDDGKSPTCVKADDPRFVSVIVDRVAIDRRTGQAVNNSKYGETLEGKPVVHRGLTYRFPFDAEKKTYQVYNSLTGKTIDAKYIGESTVGDIDVYKFVATLPKTAAEIVPGVDGFIEQKTTYYVEPNTGSILWAKDSQVRSLPGDIVALKLDVQTSDNSDSHAMTEDALQKMQLVTVIAPIVLAVLGLLAIAGAWWLGRRRGDGADHSADHSADNEPQDKLDYTPWTPDNLDTVEEADEAEPERKQLH